MITTLVFDVNETMLDLEVLDLHFERIFGDAAVRNEWFALVLRNALTLTIIGDYRDFGSVGAESLAMVAAAHGVELAPAESQAVGAAMRQLPPHPDVARSLHRLSAAGLQLVSLTNSPPDIATAQLAHAGLADHFDRILSVHSTGKFKPHPDTYRAAAREIGESLPAMMMVAAHDWDIAGAMEAGMQGAFVLRRGMAINPLFEAPTITAATMDAVAHEILALAT